MDEELLHRNHRLVKTGQNKIGACKQKLLDRIEQKRHFKLSFVCLDCEVELEEQN